MGRPTGKSWLPGSWQTGQSWLPGSGQTGANLAPTVNIDSVANSTSVSDNRLGPWLGLIGNILNGRLNNSLNNSLNSRQVVAKRRGAVRHPSRCCPSRPSTTTTPHGDPVQDDDDHHQRRRTRQLTHQVGDASVPRFGLEGRTLGGHCDEARTLGGHCESCGAAVPRFGTSPFISQSIFRGDGNEVCD